MKNLIAMISLLSICLTISAQAKPLCSILKESRSSNIDLSIAGCLSQDEKLRLCADLRLKADSHELKIHGCIEDERAGSIAAEDEPDYQFGARTVFNENSIVLVGLMDGACSDNTSGIAYRTACVHPAKVLKYDYNSHTHIVQLLTNDRILFIGDKKVIMGKVIAGFTRERELIDGYLPVSIRGKEHLGIGFAAAFEGGLTWVRFRTSDNRILHIVTNNDNIILIKDRHIPLPNLKRAL